MTKEELKAMLESNSTLIELGFNAARALFIRKELRDMEQSLNEEINFPKFKEAIFQDIVNSSALEEKKEEKEEVEVDENVKPVGEA